MEGETNTAASFILLKKFRRDEKSTVLTTEADPVLCQMRFSLGRT